MNYQITDHLPTFIALKNIKKPSSYSVKFYRCMKQFDSTKFRQDLQISLENFVNDMPELNLLNFNDAFQLFLNTLHIEINAHAPIKRCTRRQKRLQCKPWISKGLYVSIRNKQKLYKSHYLKGSINEKKFYKRYSNLLTKLKTTSKKYYFENQLKSASSNPKETWRILRELLPHKQHTSVAPTLEVNSSIVSNKEKIAENFNEFFANIGHKLSQDIQPSVSHTFYLKNCVTSSMILFPPTSSEVASELKRLKVNKSSSDDQIPTKFIVIAADVISPYFTYLVDFMFTKGIFPNALKIAKVIPIHKSGSKQAVENYRPISLLSPFSKIVEKIIKTRLVSFLNKNEILYKRQSGFRKKHTTMFPLIDVVTQCFENINNRLYTCAIALDIKKAFDSVNHTILLKKLSHYGIRGVCYKLFESYLTNRQQYVYVNNTISSLQVIKTGVPQGSVLGPILFLLYINDLHNVLLCNPRLFADDTLLLYSSKDLKQLETLCNNELLLVKQWMDANKLKINPSKSQAIVINHKLRSSISDISLKFNSDHIQNTKELRYLGVLIDEKLSFSSHIKILETKVTRNVGILFKLNKYLPTSALKTLYYALIHPFFSYGIRSCNKTVSAKLKSLQNKTLKAIGRLNWRKSPKHLYHRFEILKIDDLYKLELSKFMHRFFKKALPKYFETFYTEFRFSNTHNTRSSSQRLMLPYYSTNRAQKSIKFQGAKLWNSLPNSMKQLSYRKFIKEHKRWTFQNYNILQ